MSRSRTKVTMGVGSFITAGLMIINIFSKRYFDIEPVPPEAIQYILILTGGIASYFHTDGRKLIEKKIESLIEKL